MDIAADVPTTTLLPTSARAKNRWGSALRNVRACTDGSIQALSQRATANAHSAQRSLARRHSKAFSQWILTNGKQDILKLHNWTKDNPPVADEIFSNDTPTVDPTTRMAVKHNIWLKKWTTATRQTTEAEAFLQKARGKASAQAFDAPLTMEKLDKAINAMGAKKANAIDCLGKTDLERLPTGGKRELLNILRAAEDHLAWPGQILVNILTMKRVDA